MEENNKKSNEMQSRRAFFKKAVKSVLPFVAGVVLASTPNLAKANTGEEVSGCDYGCMYGCMGLCSRACSTTCVGSCRGGCSGACSYTCQNTCKGSCMGSCNTGCRSMNYF